MGLSGTFLEAPQANLKYREATLIRVILIAACSLFAGDAMAGATYKQLKSKCGKPLHWKTQSPTVEYHVNASFSDREAGSPEAQRNAILRAAEKWTFQGNANFRFSEGAPTDTLPGDSDEFHEGQLNIIGARPEPSPSTGSFWSDLINKSTATTYWRGNCETGEIQGFNTTFWDGNNVFQSEGKPGLLKHSIETIATHELGHVLGLADLNLKNSVMFWNDDAGAAPHDLFEGDIAGIQFIYGVRTTCHDGTMNGEETGVDCGGRCPPCPAPKCPSGNGAYCGRPSLGQNPDYLYDCSDGNYALTNTCNENGCETIPTGSNGECRKPTLTDAGISDAIASTDSGFLYQDGGNVADETIPDGSAHADIGLPDIDCTRDCQGKECGSDGCDGSCGFCDSPPEDSCVDGTVLREFDGAADCVAGACVYHFADKTCQCGCWAGFCTGLCGERGEPCCESNECSEGLICSADSKECCLKGDFCQKNGYASGSFCDNGQPVTCGTKGSCNVELDRVPSCPQGTVCDNGVCAGVSSSCQNDSGCSAAGGRRCAGELSYQICGNYDSDPCLDWSSVRQCTTGEQTCKTETGRCGVYGARCQDGSCEGASDGETCNSCPGDCGPCRHCGDGRADAEAHQRSAVGQDVRLEPRRERSQRLLGQGHPEAVLATFGEHRNEGRCRKEGELGLAAALGGEDHRAAPGQGQEVLHGAGRRWRRPEMDRSCFGKGGKIRLPVRERLLNKLDVEDAEAGEQGEELLKVFIVGFVFFFCHTIGVEDE